MKKILLGMLAALLFAPGAAVAAPQPVIGEIVAGVGKPNRLTIISALSCPFCKGLDRQITRQTYQSWTARGYEVELITVVAFASDRYTTALLRCNGVNGYFARQRRLYESQSMTFLVKPEEQYAKALDFSSSLGMSPARARTCLGEDMLRKVDRDTERAKSLYKYQGTPSAYINGKFVGNGIADINSAVQSGRR